MSAPIGSRTNPLRLPNSLEEYVVHRDDESRTDIGVTGSRYAGEEATVTLTVGDTWYEMDARYAHTIYTLLGESIAGAYKHNAELGVLNS